MGGVGRVHRWVCGWRESNFGMGHVGCVGPQNVDTGQKNARGRNFGVGKTYDFMNFYVFMKFYL